MPVKGLKELLFIRSSKLIQILLWKISLTRAKGGTHLKSRGRGALREKEEE